MNLQKAPRSLRFEAAVNSLGQTVENNSGKKVSAVAGLIAVASFSGAEAQQSSLPPVTVDAGTQQPVQQVVPRCDRVEHARDARGAFIRGLRHLRPTHI